MNPSRDTRDLAGAAVRDYISRAKALPRLTAERERRLARSAAAGDAVASGELACAHLRLVISLARSFVGRGLPLEDLIQEGTLGLLRAVRRFDWRRDIRFAGYAVHRIRGAISEAVASHEAATAPLADIDPVTLADVLRDDAATDPGAAALTHETVAETHRVLDELLTPRERTVITRRFGFDGQDRESLDRVGLRLGMRREGVRRVEVGAFSKLRRGLSSWPPTAGE